MRLISSVLTLLSVAAALPGCGSTSDQATSVGNATASAKLDSAEQALQAAAFLNAASDFDAAALAFTTIESPQIRKQLSGSTKLSIEDAPCDGGGSFDFSDTGGPAGSTDYLRFNFERCVDEEGTFFDGRLELICSEGEFRSDDQASCRNTVINFGQGGRPIEVRELNQEQVRISGRFTIRFGSSAVTLEQSLEARVTSADGSEEGLLVTRELEQRRAPQSANIDEITVNGEAGADYSGDNIVCNRGLVELRTINALTRDSQAGLVGGELLVRNADGAEATLEFASDGGVSVTLNGATVPFSRADFENACTF